MKKAGEVLYCKAHHERQGEGMEAPTDGRDAPLPHLTATVIRLGNDFRCKEVRFPCIIKLSF